MHESIENARHIGNVFRVINVILALIDLPLLFIRMLHAVATGYKFYLFAIFLFLVGVITGSWENRGSPFRWAQVITMVALALLIIGGLMNELNDRRRTNT